MIEDERFSIHQGPGGGRDLERYEAELDRDASAFEGKRVLEIGSGAELKFANGLKRRNINADVVSMSPAFAYERERAHALRHRTGSVIAGRAEELPFPNCSFDAVISVHVSEHLSSDQFVSSIVEVARVLRVGGFADIMPVYESSGHPNHIIENLGEQLGVDFKISWRKPRKPYRLVRFHDQTGHTEHVEVFILTLHKVDRL